MTVRQTVARRSWPIVAVLVCMTGLQVSVAALSLYVLSAVRAYVGGESLYSKGQKDAQIYLLEYTERRLESDYQRLSQALSVPIADRRAREELQKADPDLGIARQAFIDGGNHPDDVAGLIRLFRWFGDTPLMAPAVATWTEGDRVVEQMRLLVERAHQAALGGTADAEAWKQIRSQGRELNQRLTRLESEFSAQLGEASRQTQRLLLGLNGLLALVLTASGIAFVRRTARTQAMTEAEVVRRQESLQILLDSAAEGLFGVDVGGRCTFVNRAALRMLGYDDETQLLGQPIQRLIRVVPGAAAGQSDSHETEPALDTAALHSDTELYRRRGGSPFPVERWSHPMLRDGRVQGAVTTFFDISERIRLRNELRRGQILMERLVGSVTDGVITFGDDSRVLVFNGAAERLFLTPAHEALGSSIDRFFDGGLPLQARAHDGPSGELHELTGRRADGSAFRLEASSSRVLTDEGMQNTVVLRDITAREAARAERQAREALEATNRAKTDFLSRMSHELRTPLNAVIGFAQLLRVDSSRPPTAQQLVRIDHIEKAGAHLLALVNDVLDLSRIESDAMALATEPIELSAAMEEAATMVSPLVTKTGIELVISSSMVEAVDSRKRPFSQNAGGARSRPVWVNADPLRLRQVLVNLLSNAIKYNRSGGSVSVSWRVKGNECEVVIADTGQGMSPAQIERLFEPFNRLGAERSKVEGTGIGLVLSRRLVELMGGRLSITSTEGEGTVATIAIGVVRPAAPSVQKPTLPSQHGAFEAGLDVLYAEDNEVNAELVRQIVSLRPAVTLRIAENGRAALQMASARPPDLMLVDMNLGDMTGLEVARALRRNPLTRAIWLVALSADALPEQIDAAMNDGFRDYLTKPVDFRKLLLLLDAHLQTA